MDINGYFALFGLFLAIFSYFFLLVCGIAENRLLKKWKAEENKWVKPAIRFSIINFYYLIKENNPPSEFEKEFSNSFKKRYFWIGYSLIVFGFLILATSKLFS